MDSKAINKMAPNKKIPKAKSQCTKKGATMAEPAKTRDAFMNMVKPRRSGFPDLTVGMMMMLLLLLLKI